jgi:hypothetical protein
MKRQANVPKRLASSPNNADEPAQLNANCG